MIGPHGPRSSQDWVKGGLKRSRKGGGAEDQGDIAERFKITGGTGPVIVLSSSWRPVLSSRDCHPVMA